MVTDPRLEKITKVVQQRQQGIVVLEDIHDPHNAQAVIRSCDSFGIQQVYFIFEKEKHFDPYKVGRLASSTANKWLDYRMFCSTADCFAELKAKGFDTIGTAFNDRAVSLYSFDFCANPQSALCFGNEHSGLSEYALEHCDQLINIPMSGMVQSLNLSVSAAICLSEMTRQRSAKNDSFRLKPQDQEALIQELIKR